MCYVWRLGWNIHSTHDLYSSFWSITLGLPRVKIHRIISFCIRKEIQNIKLIHTNFDIQPSMEPPFTRERIYIYIYIYIWFADQKLMSRVRSVSFWWMGETLRELDEVWSKVYRVISDTIKFCLYAFTWYSFFPSLSLVILR